MVQNDGPVKIVVGNNFEDVVLDPTKDVLLEVSGAFPTLLHSHLWPLCHATCLCPLSPCGPLAPLAFPGLPLPHCMNQHIAMWLTVP